MSDLEHLRLAPDPGGRTIGEYIRLLRTEANISQQELADYAQMVQPTISDLEKGKSARPHANTLSNLQNGFSHAGLHVPIKYFDKAIDVANLPDGMEQDRRLWALMLRINTLPAPVQDRVYMAILSMVDAIETDRQFTNYNSE